MARVKASSIKKNDTIKVGSTTFKVTNVKFEGPKVLIYGSGLMHRVNPDTMVEKIN